MMHYVPLCSVYFKLLSVTSQVRKAQGYFNELQVKRSPFVDKSMIWTQFFLVNIKGKKDDFHKNTFVIENHEWEFGFRQLIP